MTPSELVDTLVALLAGEDCTFSWVAGAHHVEPDAGELIDHLATSLEGETNTWWSWPDACPRRRPVAAG